MDESDQAKSGALLRRIGHALTAEPPVGTEPRMLTRAVQVALGASVAGALSGLVPSFVGLGVAGLGGLGPSGTGITAPIARALEGRPAALWIVVALILVTLGVFAGLLSARASSRLSADATATLRVAMMRSALASSPRALDAVAQTLGVPPAPPPPPGVARPGGAQPSRGIDAVKIAVLRDSQGAAELVVAAVTSLPQALMALVAILVDVSASGSPLAFVFGAGIFVVSRLFAGRASAGVARASGTLARADAETFAEVGEKLGYLEDLRLAGAVDGAVAEVSTAAGAAATARRGLAEALAISSQTAGLVTALAPLVVLLTLALSHAEASPSEVARLLVAVPLLVGRLGAIDAMRIASIEKRPVLVGVVAILELPRDPPRSPDAQPLGSVPGPRDLAIEGVSFRPEGASRALLDDVSFAIPAGSIVGICGTSGGGKSTVLRMLLRLDAPTSGRVTVGGVPLDTIEPDDLPRLFAVATQGGRLLPRSIEANVLLGRPADGGAGREEAVRALEVAQIPELATEAGLARRFVPAPPSLSGGEQRRVLVARAIARGTDVVVLDEPEAGLPRATARALFVALEKAMEGRTLVVATHAPALLPSAIHVVLDQGKVVDQGTHDELLERCATYKKLYGEEPAT